MYQELLDRLIDIGFPEDCAEEILTNLIDVAGECGAENYVIEVERSLYVG